MRPYPCDWAYALGKPSLHAKFKQQAGDFQVRECLPFQPSGEGQHVYLRIRKTALNTQEAARRIQRFCQVKAKAIGYAGLKDKRAIGEQWFSVDMAGLAEEPPWSQLESDQIQILEVTRHRKRLRIGWVKANQFDIVLRDISADRQQWESRMQAIAKDAVPNYFGQQRFGVDFENVASSVDLLLNNETGGKRRELVAGKRGFHFSVIRAYLFNEILSSRVAAGNWQQALAGEWLILDGSHSFFQLQETDENIGQRLQRFDIHPSGPLPGREKAQSFRYDQAQRWELERLEPYRLWLDALATQGVVAGRRELRVRARHFSWHWLADRDLSISMELPAGVYATTVLRELVRLNDEADWVSVGEE